MKTETEEACIGIEVADCLEWLPSLGAGVADLVVCDSPYNIALDYGEGSPRDDREAGDFVAWCRAWVGLCHDALRPGGFLYVVISPHFGPELGVLVREAGFRRQGLIWHEKFGSYFQTRWGYEHRHVYAGWKPGGPEVWNHEDIRVPSRRQEMGDRRADPRGRVPGDVWEFSRVCGTFKERVPGVPTQLPERMVERILRAHTRPGDLVLDPFCGSGTTAFVCKQLGRRCRSCDINPEYVEIARGRCGP